MKKFLLLVLLSACTPAVARADVQAGAYSASIDVTCFMYALENADNVSARRAAHKQCIEVLNKVLEAGSK